jgi:hypothetical protein
MTRKLPDDILAKLPGTIEATLAGCVCGLATEPWETTQVDATTKLGPAPFNVSLAHTNALLELIGSPTEPVIPTGNTDTARHFGDVQIGTVKKHAADAISFAQTAGSGIATRGRPIAIGDLIFIRNIATAGFSTRPNIWLVTGTDPADITRLVAWNPAAVVSGSVGDAIAAGASSITDSGADTNGRSPYGTVVVATVLDQTHRRTAWWSVAENKIRTADMTSLDGHITAALGERKTSYLDINGLTANSTYSNCPVHGSGTNFLS